MKNVKAINLFSSVGPISHGQTVKEIADTLRQATVNVLAANASDKNAAVLIRGEDGRLYTFSVDVKPVRLDKAEEFEAIQEACPYVFIGSSTGVTEASLLDFDAEAEYVKIFKVCVAKNADDALDGKFTIVAERFSKHGAIQFANKKLGVAFDRTYECRPL